MLENTMLITRFKPVLLKRKGVAVGIWGEAGIGKSYQVTGLLRELLCRQASFHATTPLTTLAKTLPRPEKLALWATRGLERLEQGETLEPSTILDALGATLAGLAPFVLHLEDLHEANTERLEFIQNLARMVQRIKGVGLIVTSRTEQPEPFVTVRLEPLPPESSSLLLEQELKAILPGQALTWLYDKAAGNPLYTLEYLRYLTRQGFLWSDGKSWHWRKPEGQFMPVTVEALIEQLLIQAKAEPLQRYVLETKALLPLNASDELWCKVARVNAQELETAVTALSHQGVFQGKGFAHPLFREVTLKTMGVARKRDLSRRAINALEAEPDQAALFVEEAGLEREQSLEILKRAVEQTKERNKVEAARFLAKAVNYATGEEKGKLALGAAEKLEPFNLVEATQLAEVAWNSQPQDETSVYFLAELYARQGRSQDVERVLAKLSNEQRTGEDWLFKLFKLKSKSSQHTAALEMFATFPILQQIKDAETLGLFAASLMNLGNYQEAEVICVRALKLVHPGSSMEAKLLGILASISSSTGDYSQALAYYQRSLEVLKDSDNQFAYATTLFNASATLIYFSDYVTAQSYLTEALTLYREMGDGLSSAETQGRLGAILAEMGDYQGAEDVLLESRDVLLRVEPSGFLVDCECSLSSLYFYWGSAHSKPLVLKYASKALELARQLSGARIISHALVFTAIAEVENGNPKKGLAHAQEALELSQQLGNPQRLCMANWVKALALEALHASSEAHSFFCEALTLAQQLKATFLEHKIGLELDRLNNDIDSARDRLKWFEERGLMNGANIARRYFPELAETTPSPEIVETNLRLEVLGSMQIFANGKQGLVRGRKRKELFACLLEARLAGRSHLSHLDLADKLHPENPDENLETLKQLVYQVRVAFGQTVIITTGNGYALGAISSDAETFLENGDTNLWRGEYLEGVTSSDGTVSDALHHALSGRIEALLETDPAEAARIGRMLVNAEPYELESWRLILKAVRQSSTLQSVEKLYRECRKRLAEVGEVLPESWEVFLNQVAPPNL
jgi:tetratricopeptide (TPR) repeat protein